MARGSRPNIEQTLTKDKGQSSSSTANHCCAARSSSRARLVVDPTEYFWKHLMASRRTARTSLTSPLSGTVCAAETLMGIIASCRMDCSRPGESSENEDDLDGSSVNTSVALRFIASTSRPLPTACRAYRIGASCVPWSFNGLSRRCL